jgi:protein-L-isoaspartate(D-aspartate) O-methyltransferase|tara:strand:+ start:3646 stop:4368 length:723 start_codon:yes stop_codon:yes gene_type:complete
MIRCVAAVLCCLLVSSQAAGEEWAKMRERMVQEIASETYTTRHYLGKAELDEKVMQAIGKVPRHEFVPDQFQRDSYANQPLPIGEGQTISQPFIVALMTDLLEVDENDSVLELGTGSGYQAAVLAELVAHVYTIEIVESLGEQARSRLLELGYDNVHSRIGDGFYGWPEHAPYDGVIVTAAGIGVPPELIKQLKTNGKLVIPVGEQHATQHLMVITKNADGSTTSKNVLPVRFVPITGDH